jgi:hypothetical protein
VRCGEKKDFTECPSINDLMLGKGQMIPPNLVLTLQKGFFYRLVSPQRRKVEMFVVAIGLYALSSFILLILEFRKMGLISRISLLIQFAALFMMVVAWLGISF